MTHRCTKCGRRMKRATASGMGATCERNVLGTKQKRQRATPPADTSTADLFAEDLAYANRVETLLSSISLEMP